MKRIFHIFIILTISVVLGSANSCKTGPRKVVEETYPDGSPKVVKYFNDTPHGKELVKEISFYPNNKKKVEGEYKDSLRTGTWVSFYENGNKWSEGKYVAGISDGPRITYYENGKKRYEGQYKKGDRSGNWRFYKENGDLEKQVDYDQDTLVK